MQRPSLDDYLGFLEWAVGAMEDFDALGQRVPVVRTLRGKLLDTIFGPEDDWDYVSTTTAPPPPIDSQSAGNTCK